MHAPFPSPQCSCAMERQNAEHSLQPCPLIEHQMKGVWPVFTSVQRHLYSKTEELTKTACFIDVPR